MSDAQPPGKPEAKPKLELTLGRPASTSDADLRKFAHELFQAMQAAGKRTQADTTNRTDANPSQHDQGGFEMPRTNPWHSVKEPVHHDNTNCNTGNNIEKENVRQGTGGKPLCGECAKLNREGK